MEVLGDFAKVTDANGITYFIPRTMAEKMADSDELASMALDIFIERDNGSKSSFKPKAFGSY